MIEVAGAGVAGMAWWRHHRVRMRNVVFGIVTIRTMSRDRVARIRRASPCVDRCWSICCCIQICSCMGDCNLESDHQVELTSRQRNDKRRQWSVVFVFVFVEVVSMSPLPSRSTILRRQESASSLRSRSQSWGGTKYRCREALSRSATRIATVVS